MENTEILKDVLSEDTYNKFVEETKDSEMRLADLSGGGYVSKEKYGALESQMQGLQEQNGTLSASLEDLKKTAGDNEALKNQIDQLKAKSESDMQNLTNSFQEKLKAAAVTTGLLAAGARDPKDVISHLDMEAIQYGDDKLTGFEEQLTEIRKNKAYLFKEAETKKTGLPHGGGTGGTDLNEMRKIAGLPPKK